MIMRLILLFLILICSINGYSQYLGNIFTKGVKSDYIFIVDKEAKKLKVVEIVNDEISVIQEYGNILLGEIEGDKQKEGDKKTPEGVYKIISFIPPSKLSKIYGDGAYPLNYPNPVDKILGKTGYGIWIHGLEEGGNKTFTQGCVALHNGDLKNLGTFNPIGKDVIITKETKYLDVTDYISQKSYWINYIDSYLNSWENNDFQKFSNFYHILFKNNIGQNLKKYLLMKKKLMNIYPYKRIYVDEMKILKEDDKEVFINFRQLYCAPNLLNEGYKQLFLYNDTGKFQIIYESYKSTKNYEMLEQFIKSFVDNWKKSWESKNLDKYITFYSKKFFAKGFKRDGWKEYKRNIFKKYKKISLEISDMNFKIVNPLLVEVVFKQRYKADSFEDYGLKKLILKGCPGDYKIYRESWSKIK
ncbi:L,D-transpeptidase family protein [Deferribacter abyssi]|uniref:L,D-transpeptidase family protein n=1 Tax=Deferribacter abyssi TaxID=213806 RepID=UPI003C182E2A